MGTDGVDGNSPAAGALVDGYTGEEAERAGLNPLEHLDDNDGYTLFHKLGRAIYTGPTGTNVNYVFIALVYR
jgi:glycerate 2-kinase